MCGCEKHHNWGANCTCICREHRNFERAYDLAMVRYDEIRALRERLTEAERERDEWRARRDRAVETCRFRHQEGLTAKEWHIKICAAAEGAAREQARAEQAEAALEAGDACGAVGCRTLAERDRLHAGIEALIAANDAQFPHNRAAARYTGVGSNALRALLDGESRLLLSGPTPRPHRPRSRAMSDEREALAEVLATEICWRSSACGPCHRSANAVTESQWLARVKATARAEALREAAEAIADLPCPGSPPDPLARYAFETAKDHAAHLLNDRADAIDGGVPR